MKRKIHPRWVVMNVLSVAAWATGLEIAPLEVAGGVAEVYGVVFSLLVAETSASAVAKVVIWQRTVSCRKMHATTVAKAATLPRNAKLPAVSASSTVTTVESQDTWCVIVSMLMNRSATPVGVLVISRRSATKFAATDARRSDMLLSTAVRKMR